MGTGASKNPLRSTANAGIVASRWKTNARQSTSSSINASGSSNLAPGTDNSKLKRPASDGKDLKDIKAEGR